MATTSFDKSFVVRDSKSIEKVRDSFQHPKLVKVLKRDYAKESDKGIKLLRGQFSGSVNS